jgi:hypothetical protein
MNQHLTKLDKVTVGLVVDFDGSPCVCSASNTATVGRGYKSVGTDNSEGNFALNAVYNDEQLILSHSKYPTGLTKISSFSAIVSSSSLS